MSANCGVCGKECKRDGNEVVCDGGCREIFHQNCVKGDVEGKKTRSGNYTCKKCRSNLKEFITQAMKDLKTEIVGEVHTLKAEVTELSKSVEFLSTQSDTNKELLQDVKGELAKLRKENAELNGKCAALTEELTDTKERLRNLEQYTRKNNIEVSGIPVTASEDVSSIVKDLGAALGIDVDESQVTAAHRIPSFKKERPPALIVQFQKKAQKDTWISKFKEAKDLTADKVNPHFAKQKIYVNDHLCPENKIFLGKLKTKCNAIGYEYAWSRDGKFFARKSQGSKCIKVVTLKDIEHLK